MAHPLVMGLFSERSSAAAAARELRGLGVAREAVSIVARSHEEEGDLAAEAGASPGSEIEDSQRASTLGELSGHLFAAIALVMPGIGPIVADGPLAAELGEAAGHLAGGLKRTLERTGLDHATAGEWASRIHEGDVLVGAHVRDDLVQAARDALMGGGAARLAIGTWPD